MGLCVLCHPSQGGNLPHKAPDGQGRRAHDFRTGGYVAHKTGLRGHAGTRANGEVPGHAHLPAQRGEVPHAGRARDAALRDDNGTPAHDHVVADLHQVVYPHAIADDGVWPRAPVYAGVRADLHVRADEYAAQLRHLCVAAAPMAKPKPSCPTRAPG
jgi:hypothetical protein